ncbi:hypothetical protein BO71DRAFT_435570 [Aspergillus ellipticus CBS 707.79]|uniref:Fungal STAND N-terminal Goodbye domain-containing protein n=1 Tax=Aspergillus ellipticus CBS 707.79 TaxID=1448320 RepID=A0A319D266_9EURO|nr:hypothetical protein BO71DRAFT_435570 [Aspergillus ellipticus CBS 707.79]
MSASTPVEKLQQILQTSCLDGDSQEQLAKTWVQVDEHMRILFESSWGYKGVDKMQIQKVIKAAASAETKTHGGLVPAVNTFCDLADTLGTQVAGGVSMVFSPATPCFAGLALLLKSAKPYADILTEVEGLLQKCIMGLDNLERMNINSELATKVHRLLALFLSICCEWDKLRKSPTHRMGATFKSTFLNDSLVQKCTAQLDELTKDRNGAILNQVHRATHFESQKRNWLQTIAQGISFNPSDLDQNEESMRSCLGVAYKVPFQGTGAWIHGLNEFGDWRKGTDPVLFLTGNSREGKTLAMANVVSSVGSSGALYGKAQIVPLARSMAELMQRRKFTTSINLWTELLLKNQARKAMDHTLYILIDGFSSANNNDPLIPLIQSALTLTHNNKIRVLITSTPERQQSLLGNDRKLNVIDVPLHSENDIEIYAKVRLDRMRLLSNTSHPLVMQYRNTIIAVLCRKGRGAWTKVINILDLIGRHDGSPTQIDQILKTLDASSQASTSELVCQLEKDLSVEQIMEVNTVISWIEEGLRPLTSQELDAALSMYCETQWFQDFPTRIKSYPIFDVNQVGEVGWRSPDIESYISDEDRQASSSKRLYSDSIKPGFVHIFIKL